MEYLFPEICRVCEKRTSLKPLFHQDNQVILQQLRACAEISIEWTDLLPKFICSVCIVQLENAYSFKMKCESADRRLREAVDLALSSKPEATIEIDQETFDENYQYEQLIESDYEGEMNVEATEPDESQYTVQYLDEAMDDVEVVEQKADIDGTSVVEENLNADETQNNESIEVEEIDKTKTNSKTNSKRSFACSTCDAVFYSKPELNIHVKTHGKNRYPCPICGKWFKRRYHMISHTHTHKGIEKSFTCSTCGKSYTSQTNLDRHIRVTHKNEKKYKCEKCGKCFSQLTILRVHHSVHTSERNFQCNLCDKKFKLKEHLLSHQIRHLPKSEQPVRNYKPQRKKYKPKLKTCVCSVCGKQSSTTALHMSHMKTHSGEKPYECKECGKKFSFKQSLKNHSYLHTGEKKFKCETCGISFRQIGHLKVHKLSHTGERKHVCSECGKTFSIRSNLTVHMRVHTGETPYHCTICPKKFYDSNGLKRHRLVHERRNERIEGDQVNVDMTNIETVENELNGQYVMSHSLASPKNGFIFATDETQYKVELPNICDSSII